MYKWKGDLLSKYLLLILVCVLVLNSILIAGVQILISYPLRSHRAVLEPYNDYNIIDIAGGDQLMAFLLAAPGKESRLLVTEKHFFASRCHVVLDTEVNRHYATDIRSNIGTVHVHLEGISRIGGLSFQGISLPIRISTFTYRIPGSFLLWNLLLLTLEILTAVLFHKLRTR